MILARMPRWIESLNRFPWKPSQLVEGDYPIVLECSQSTDYVLYHWIANELRLPFQYGNHSLYH